ncbi:zinc finger MYND domain-containing protein [Phanerochaete sordida]|uniref:Zinc finger MYND domain-containing protein n=1 Tax=Phanerochaete sordida TaxID=48140 RepID=A0A9P3G8G6_9APHY|nr:zinc finger MYND domain-containing protein [Phanerochaete sordida]
MSLWCAVCDDDAHLVCSGCKTTRYCSKECQMVDWKERGHKKGCELQKVLNEFNAKQEAQKPARPAKGRCTGCNTRFDDDDYCDQECPECGYQTCESCACHSSRGTCWCPNGNFGTRYCERAPRQYHFDGRTGRSYRGDYHPPLEEWSDELTAQDYEGAPRACNNCGEVKLMLKRS